MFACSWLKALKKALKALKSFDESRLDQTALWPKVTAVDIETMTCAFTCIKLQRDMYYHVDMSVV